MQQEVPRDQPGGRPTAERTRDAISAAFGRVTGEAIPVNVLRWMLVQIWLETDQGRALWRNNVGNITAGSAWSGTIWRPNWYYEPGPDASARTRELHELMLQGRAPSAFRAYPSLEAGAEDYVRVVMRQFPQLYRAMYDGDASGVALAVRESRYCPDCSTNPEPWNAMARQLAPVLPKAQPHGPGKMLAVIGLATLAATAGYGAYRATRLQKRAAIG